MIHSLYSNKDIFLRELISNASTRRQAALRGLSDGALYENDPTSRSASPSTARRAR